jgi:hypothetical protein
MGCAGLLLRPRRRLLRRPRGWLSRLRGLLLRPTGRLLLRGLLLQGLLLRPRGWLSRLLLRPRGWLSRLLLRPRGWLNRLLRPFGLLLGRPPGLRSSRLRSRDGRNGPGRRLLALLGRPPGLLLRRLLRRLRRLLPWGARRLFHRHSSDPCRPLRIGLWARLSPVGRSRLHLGAGARSHSAWSAGPFTRRIQSPRTAFCRRIALQRRFLAGFA